MKLVIQAERRAAPGSHIMLSPKLREAIEALKVDGWKVTLFESTEGVYPYTTVGEDEDDLPPSWQPVDIDNWTWVPPNWVPKSATDNRSSVTGDLPPSSLRHSPKAPQDAEDTQ